MGPAPGVGWEPARREGPAVSPHWQVRDGKVREAERQARDRTRTLGRLTLVLTLPLPRGWLSVVKQAGLRDVDGAERAPWSWPRASWSLPAHAGSQPAPRGWDRLHQEESKWEGGCWRTEQVWGNLQWPMVGHWPGQPMAWSPPPLRQEQRLSRKGQPGSEALGEPAGAEQTAERTRAWCCGCFSEPGVARGCTVRGTGWSPPGPLSTRRRRHSGAGRAPAVSLLRAPP